MLDALLSTKLQIPPSRTTTVKRPRLLARLNDGLDKKLTLVSAPAGSGKTTLLANWIPQSGTAHAWLSLDQEDNDLNRFWIYIVAALQTALPESALGEASMVALRSTPSPSIERVLAGLINELVEAPTAITLVLDDYHLVEQQTIHRSLAFLLDRMPASLHLVMASRTDPPIPLARLRVRGQLNELNATDLRFSEDEAAAFLSDVMGLQMDAEEVGALEARTEGWIAALQIAALSLRGRPDPAAFIRRFRGSHRHLLDYLAQEVLQQQPPAVQQFLLYTSILDRFSAPLCNAVTQSPVAQAMLARLERANLFLIPLDDEGNWYRYHHLFGDFLRKYLEENDPDVLAELHHRASVWLDDEGFTESAVEHAMAAREYDRAAELIERSASSSLRRRADMQIYRWLRTLPDEVIRSRPVLGLAYAWGLCRDGHYQPSEEWLSLVEERYQQASGAAYPNLPSISDAMLGEVKSVRAVIACFQGNMERAMALSRQALAILPADQHVLRGVLADNMAMNIADAVGGSGDLATAGKIYREAVAAGRASSNSQVTAFALNRLAQWQMGQGQLRQAESTLKEVFQLFSAGRSAPSPGETGTAHLGLSWLAYQWNRLAEAEGHLQQAGVLLQTGNPLLSPSVFTARAFLLQAQKKPDEARQQMHHAVDLARDSNITWMASNVLAAEARLALRQRDLEAAGNWADTCGLDVGDELGINRLDEYTTLARVRLAQGDAMAARDLLSWLQEFVTPLGLAGSVVEIQLLQALTNLALGDRELALAELGRSVVSAAPAGYMRLFLDEGRTVARLFERLPDGDGKAASHLIQLRQAFSEDAASSVRPPSGILPDPLSEREIEVLRLLAADLTSSDIAGELTIAVATVRTHRKNIYSKLDVHSRYEAVVRARELQLL